MSRYYSGPNFDHFDGERFRSTCLQRFLEPSSCRLIFIGSSTAGRLRPLARPWGIRLVASGSKRRAACADDHRRKKITVRERDQGYRRPSMAYAPKAFGLRHGLKARLGASPLLATPVCVRGTLRIAAVLSRQGVSKLEILDRHRIHRETVHH